jgi:DNA-binding MarR family transcriptional regulator
MEIVEARLAATEDTEALPPHLIPYLINRVAGTFNRRWLEHLRGEGMTVARWQVLAILSEYDGARPGQLAAMAATEQSVTSRVIDQMERDDLVERRPAADDRRAVEVYLTPRGRASFESLLPAANTLVGTALEGIPPETSRQLVDGLVRLVANLERPAAATESRDDVDR